MDKVELQNILKSVTDSFLIEGTTTSDINNGECIDWAEKILKELYSSHLRVEIWETKRYFADTSHCFVRINARLYGADCLFYDAECLSGVADHMELPLFAKIVDICGRQPVQVIDSNFTRILGNTYTETERDCG